jgi:hypothetical protein
MSASIEEMRRLLRGRDGPIWRWKLAGTLGGTNSRRLLRLADPIVLEARDYLRRRDRGPEQAAKASTKYPRIAAAEQLSKDSAACDTLKVLVLGNCPPQEIGERLQLPVDTLLVWEELFFDVRAARHAVSWVHGNVILPEFKCGNGALAVRMQLAFAAGPVGARAALDAEARAPLDEAEQLVQQKLRLYLLFQQAIQMPLDTERDKFRIIKLHLDLLGREQRLRLAERKLEQRSGEALASQKAAEARLEFAREREEHRAQERARRAAEREQRREEIRLQALRRQAHLVARQQRREDRKRAAKERAAGSLLAQLHWAFATSPQFASGAGQLDAGTPNGAAFLCVAPECEEGALTCEPEGVPWIDEVPQEMAEELCEV